MRQSKNEFVNRIIDKTLGSLFLCAHIMAIKAKHLWMASKQAHENLGEPLSGDYALT